nr:MAG TPA: hypothetical protein [Caudoviricetes sp.]
MTQSVSGKFANRNNAAILTAVKYKPHHRMKLGASFGGVQFKNCVKV